MNLRRIEEASLNAWPALQQTVFDGWILRFSRGYTKRANSVNPLYGSSSPVEDKISRCERWYRERNLQPIFRLTPFASPPPLDTILERRGYQKIDVTLVEYLALGGAPRSGPRPSGSAQLEERDLDEWMAIFCRCKVSSVEKHRTHRQILETIIWPRLLAILVDSEQVVACGLGVLEDDTFGLFDLITAPPHRGQGHGTALIYHMLNWARQRGARHAYLQVVRTNAPARHLYDKFGFQEAYRYWYRLTDR